jgi:Stage II sporulation protein E (SpoIIE)
MSGLQSRAPVAEWVSQPWERPTGGEVLLGNASAAALYLAGGGLCATAPLLPHLASLAGVTAVGVSAVLVATALLALVRAGRGDLTLSWAVELAGVLLIAVVCASSGGAGSPYAVMYLFAVGHAAAFQPRARLAIVTLVAFAAFLAPVAYETVDTGFAAVAVIGIVLATLTIGMVHVTLNQIRAQRRLMRVMVAATATLTSSLDPTHAMREFARALVPELVDICWIDLLRPDGSIGDTVAATAAPARAAQLERIAKTSPLSVSGPHPVARVLRSGEALTSPISSESQFDLFARNAEDLELMRRFGGGVAAVYPLLARGRTRGAISFVRIGAERFPPDALDLLADLSGRAAMAFDNARLYAERTRVAHTLRRSLMPSVLPSIPGLELVSFFRPLGAGSEVGGDFYDAFGESGRWWLIVGDVCGKGAEAAALTGFLRHTTAALTREAIRPATVLSRVNHLMLSQDFDGRFATAALVRVRKLDTRAEVTLASAGHPPALVVRADGRVEQLGQRGTLLGVFPDPIITESSAVLEMGDAVALYTDGLLEAHAPERIVTPEELVAHLERVPGPRDARGTLEALLGVVDLGDNVRDDIVVLVGQMTPRSAREDDAAKSAIKLRRRDEHSAPIEPSAAS